MNIAEIEISYKTNVKASERTKVLSSKDAYNVLKSVINPNTIELHESFYLLVLNRNNHVLGWVKTSQGGIAGTVVDIRHIFSIALKANASGIIIAHNHPSGNINPSPEDLKITQRIKEAGKLLEISLLDHLIITDESFYSFGDEGQL